MKLTKEIPDDFFRKETLTLAELYTIELAEGFKLYFTNFAEDIVFDGVEYKAAPVQRGEITYNSNLQADEVTVTFNPVSMEIVKYVSKSILDNAKLTITMIWFDPIVGAGYSKDIFYGVCNTAFTPTSVTLNAVSVIAFSGLIVPKNYYSSTCNWVLYSKYCGVRKSAYTRRRTVLGGDEGYLILNTDDEIERFLGGEVSVVSGENKGCVRTVIGVVKEKKIVTLSRPLFRIPKSGDLVDITYGCQKTKEYCQEVFNNEQNFFGFPYVPRPDEAFG